MPPENEPDSVPKPNASVDGSVKAAGDAAAAAVAAGTISKVEYDKIMDENRKLKEFTSGVLNYTERDENGNPTKWDTKKILAETVEDEAKRKKMLDVLEDTIAENAPTNPPTGPDPKAQFELLQKDPEGFLREHTKKVVEQVRADLMKEMAPLKNDVASYKVRDMVSEVRAVHPDFDNHSKEILEISKNRPPRTARELESIFFEVLGRKGVAANNANPPGGDLARSASGIRAPTSDKKYADDVFDRMMHSGVSADKRNGSLQTLFGKDHLIPLE